MIHISTLLKHYKRKDVQDAIVHSAIDKEIAMLFGENGFGKRPDIISYPRDVLNLAMRGATSFHCSEELWTNPLQLSTGLKRQELDSLRKGWDLILDIDCKEWRFSQVAADLLVQALSYHDIKCITAKFSGNHGFHIAVPFESFPESVHNTPVSSLFPDGPRKIAAYLQEMIRPHLSAKLAKTMSVAKIAQLVGKQPSEVVTAGAFDPFKVLAIDTVLIASRHLYRMPYSFNEKSGLVSIPVDPWKIMEFDKATAHPDKVKVQHSFLDRKAGSNEARRLLIQAYDFKPAIKEEKTSKQHTGPESPVKEDLFPPCIKLLANGVADGRKRALFALINFLSSVGWTDQQIQDYLKAWNQRNKEPLREGYVMGQLKYAVGKKVLPPNCDNAAYYLDIGVCRPDGFCKRIKNPANYSLLKFRFSKRDEQKAKHKAESK
ncbi:hypothetical protein HY642_02075 [Candidatus Woesearchaeota archaeon]|nr:hypothetical protein [Candidatus Woesearchaeota archaeon]